MSSPPCAAVDDEGYALQGWQKLLDISIARSRKVKGGNYVQLATVSADGKPHCRTVVFRGFVKMGSATISQCGDRSPRQWGNRTRALKMISDARAEKVKEVAHSPACEMVWWFGKSNEQYRISGALQLVGAAEQDEELQSERKQQWGNLSDTSREQFYWNHPGRPFEGVADVPKAGRDEEGRVLPVPDSFLLVLLWPEQVRYLRLTDNYAQLDVVDAASGAWSQERVNP